MHLTRQTRNFLIIGLIGLGVDMAAFALLAMLLPDLLARALSIAIAMTATWQLNRRHSFAALQHKPMLREYAEYVVASLVGAVVNYGIYAGMNALFTPFIFSDYLFICISSATAAGVNFLLYQQVVFKEKRPQ